MIIFDKIKNKFSLVALAIPAYAALELKPGDDFSTLTDVTAPNIISGAVSLVLILSFVVFFFVLILGALKWITSSGDEKKLSSAKAQITNALIGVVLILSVWAILNLVQSLFGLSILEDGLSIPSFIGGGGSSTTSGGGSSVNHLMRE